MKSHNSRIAIANDKITVYIHYHPLFDDPHSRAEEAHYNFAVLPSKTRKSEKDSTLNYHTVKALQIMRGSTRLSQKHHCSGVFGKFPSTYLITSELIVGETWRSICMKIPPCDLNAKLERRPTWNATRPVWYDADPQRLQPNTYWSPKPQ